MELEDLKQNWKNAADQYTVSAYDLNTVLAKKVNDPLSLLKAKYFKQLFLLPAAAAVLIVTNLANPALHQNLMVWLAIPVLLLLSLNYYYNYKTVVRMQQPSDSKVKENLEKNLAFLQHNGRLQLRGARIFIVLLIGSMELSLYYHLIPEYRNLEAIAVPVRTGFYLFLLVVQPYISKFFFKQNFGQYINRLQELLDQAS